MLIYCIIGLLFAIYFYAESNLGGEYIKVSIGDVYIFLSVILVWPLTLIIHYLGKTVDLDKPFFVVRFKKDDDDHVKM